MKRRTTRGLSMLLALTMLPTMMSAAAFAAEEAQVISVDTAEIQLQAESFASGSGTADDPYVITDAQQLAAINGDLDACYKLGSDIDLSSYGNWTPIGTFTPLESDAEKPDPSTAFQGVFDGDGHTVSGMTINNVDTCAGLFGVAAGATIKNLTVTNASVSNAVVLSAAVVGYSCDSTLEDITLKGKNRVSAKSGASYYMGNAVVDPSLIGGIVGGSKNTACIDCAVRGTAKAYTKVTATGADSAASNATQYIGILGGGLEEDGTMSGCSVKYGRVTVIDPEDGGDSGIGYSIDGVGGLAGCTMQYKYMKNCSVENVTIKSDAGSVMVGGLVGFTGKTDGKTKISNCDVSNTTVTTGKQSERVGGLIGSGFYIEAYAVYYPEATKFSVDSKSSVTRTAVTAGRGSLDVNEIVGSATGSTVKAKQSKVVVAYIPASPELNSVSEVSKGIKAEWSEVKGADGYIVYRRAAGSAKYDRVKTTSKLSYTDTAAKKGVKYSYKVRAYVKTDGGKRLYSAASSVKSIKR